MVQIILIVTSVAFITFIISAIFLFRALSKSKEVITKEVVDHQHVVYKLKAQKFDFDVYDLQQFSLLHGSVSDRLLACKIGENKPKVSHRTFEAVNSFEVVEYA